ncbi:hypothetical protein F4808DRAFT_406348 [Astrocystis sublimbata]|nr:hypothetical protein F4808DRAFT_406348 [Astrocystis sublimbata]
MPNLVDLPHDIFILIVHYLSPTDCTRCWRVCNSWNSTFRSDVVCEFIMKQHFPRVREMRNAGGSSDCQWVQIFAEVARRYFRLRSARPRRLQKIDIARQTPLETTFEANEPWIRFQSLGNYQAIFRYRDLTWCMDDGLLIYRERAQGYAVHDLETGRRLSVPFDGTQKTVSCLRLTQGTLLVEWFKPNIHGERQHYATAFDLRRPTTVSRIKCSPEIRLRSEWSLPLPVPPRSKDVRTFSAHTSTHYALYHWCCLSRPPEEGLQIWEIGDTLSNTRTRPICRLSRLQLHHMGVAQGMFPTMWGVFLDEDNVYIHEEDHPWLVTDDSRHMQPRSHHVWSTGIPFGGIGPAWFDECCADNGVDLSFCPRVGSLARSSNSGRCTSAQDGSLWPGHAPCWRHEEFPYLTVSEVVDRQTGVRVAARSCFSMERLSSFVLPRISLQAGPDAANEARFEDHMWAELLGKGKIMGDERWLAGEDSEGRITVAYF